MGKKKVTDLEAGNGVISTWPRGPKEADPNVEVVKVEKQPELYHRSPKSRKKSYT